MPKVSKKQNTFEDLLKDTSKLSKKDFRKLITNYLKSNGGEMDARYEKVVLTDLENHLKDLHVNDECPYCHSKIIVANGKRDTGVQRMKCSECGKSFTYFTGTILEKTKFHWDIWVELIYQMLQKNSIKKIKNNLIAEDYTEYITESTIEKWRYKILNACEQIEQPELSGVIQIDETHYHESQKGVKEEDMVQVFPTLERKARYSYRPAQYGVMGSEFATIITAVDKTGHCVCKVSGLGKFDNKAFTKLFRNHIKNCDWLCTDNNKVYGTYCDTYDVQHYIRPSDYLEKVEGKSADDCEKLYNNCELDYVEHRDLTYNQIEKLKYKYGLNLGMVNSLHQRIREFVNYSYNGLSTKHLPGWISWFALLENFRADTGHIPSSHKDAEEILKIILKSKKNIIVQDMFNKPLNLPKPSDSALKRLKENTDKGRELSGRKRFVFSEEDLLEGGAIRDALYKMPLYLFKELCKHYASTNKSKYKGYTSYLNTGKRLKFVQILEKEKDIRQQMLMVTAQTGKTIYTSEEDPAHRNPNPYINY